MSRPHLLNSWHDLPWPDIRQRLNILLPKFVLALLVVMLAQTCAELTWKIFAVSDVTVSAGAKSNASQNSQFSNSASVAASLNKVSQYHLFGEVTKQPALVQKMIQAPDTRLSLKLKGVFAASDPAVAIAIISDGKGEDKTYYVGDKISGGAILHAVYVDRVILKRNGRLETLRLPKPALDTSAIITPSTVPVIDNSLPAATGKMGLGELRDTFLSDPAKIWKEVRITPVMEKGKVKGYTLLHNNQAFMKSLNIRPTDIITGVNGQALSDPSTLYGLMSNLSQAQSLQLTIERDGQQQEIELSF